MTTAAAPEPTTPPTDLAKGAWGGAWTVVYGSVSVVFGVMNVVSNHMLVTLADLGTAALQRMVVEEEDADAPRRLAALVDAAPDALGLGFARWHWLAAGLGIGAIVAGLAVLRRSETGRRAAVFLCAASAGLSLLLTAAWGVFVMPKYGAWVGELREILAEAERASGGRAGPDFSMMFSSSPVQQLVWQAGMQTIHAGIVWILVSRLRGAETRAWCSGASPRAPSR